VVAGVAGLEERGDPPGRRRAIAEAEGEEDLPLAPREEQVAMPQREEVLVKTPLGGMALTGGREEAEARRPKVETESVLVVTGGMEVDPMGEPAAAAIILLPPVAG